ncbi:MAG TPA: glycerol-3-phosphate dehydrogenase/oxidase [Actinoplanes sp.]
MTGPAADLPAEPGALTPGRRRDALAGAFAGEFDVVVVGGGVTGAGCALDAAARGLSVVLLEAGDIAAGTSSRSGKTFHGGLRYLEQLNLSLVQSALAERNLMVSTLCPHLARPEPFLYPLTRHWERPYVGAGIAVYDAMALRGAGVPRHRHLTRGGAVRRAPALDPARITGAVQYYDVRIDDARHTLTLARTADRYGAQVISRARVTDVLRAGGRVTGVRVRDELTGDTGTVRARVVINAAGVWAEQVQRLAGLNSFEVRPSRGTHLVVPAAVVDSSTGILARADDSVLVVRRWNEHWIIGTTDLPHDGDLRDPVATDAEVRYLLDNTNRYLRRPVRREDVVGVYAGLRPLLRPVAGHGEATSALSRDHAVLPGPPGMVTIVGGKYTTYRRMAADAVDAAGRMLDRRLPATPTASLPLLGADSWQVVRNRATQLAGRYGVHPSDVLRLVGRYGNLTEDVLRPAEHDPALARAVPGAGGHLAAEFRYAAAAEGASTLDDVLSRRTHVAIEVADGGAAAAPVVAALVAPVLGWDDAACAAQVTAYRRGLIRDRAPLAV